MMIFTLIIVSVVSTASIDLTALIASIASVLVDSVIAPSASVTTFTAVDSITSILLIASAVEVLVVDSVAVSLVVDSEIASEAATIAHLLGVITIIITQQMGIIIVPAQLLHQETLLEQ